MIPKEVIEFSVIGADVEEHNVDYETAKDFFNSLSTSKRKKVQFFKKTWVFDSKNKEYEEGEVVLISSYKREKID